MAKIDRLSRSTFDFAQLMDRFRSEGWQLVILDLDIDTSTPVGEAIAGVFAVFAQLERRMIGERTKSALAALKAQGVHVGRPNSVSDELRAEIRSLAHMGPGKIATLLNERGEPTARGGRRWYPSTIRRILESD